MVSPEDETPPPLLFPHDDKETAKDKKPIKNKQQVLRDEKRFLPKAKEQPLLETKEQPLLEAGEQLLLEAGEQLLLETKEQPLLETEEQPLLEAKERPLLETKEQPLPKTEARLALAMLSRLFFLCIFSILFVFYTNLFNDAISVIETKLASLA